MRPIEKRDVPSATKLLRNYLKGFQLAPELDQDEFEYLFLTREGVIYTYVSARPSLHHISCAMYSKSCA